MHQPPAASPEEEHEEEVPGRSDIWSEKMQFAIVEDDTDLDSTWAEERTGALLSAAAASKAGQDRRLSAPPVGSAAASGAGKGRPPSAMPVLQAPAPAAGLPHKEEPAAASGPAPQGKEPESPEKGLDNEAEAAPEGPAPVIKTEAEAQESSAAASVVRQEAALESSSPRTAVPAQQPQPPPAASSSQKKWKAAPGAVKMEDFLPSSGTAFPKTHVSASKAKPGSVMAPTGLPTQPPGSPGVSVAPRPPRAANARSQHRPGSEIEDKESARRVAEMHAQAVRMSQKRIDVAEGSGSTSKEASGDATKGEEKATKKPPAHRPSSALR